MTFIETKKKDAQGFDYHLEEIFGTLDIDSTARLDADQLDGIVCLLLKQNIQASVVEGRVAQDKNIIKYKFVKVPAWSDDDEDDETCENTPTSTRVPANGSMLTKRLHPSKWISGTWNWCRRFAGAFREAWKKAK